MKGNKEKRNGMTNEIRTHYERKRSNHSQTHPEPSFFAHGGWWA